MALNDDGKPIIAHTRDEAKQVNEQCSMKSKLASTTRGSRSTWPRFHLASTRGNQVMINPNVTVVGEHSVVQIPLGLADFSAYRGANFIRRFSVSPGVSKETILSFVGDNANIEDINVRTRVILVARSFDDSVLSLGEWLSSKGVGFRCISYTPFQIDEGQYLSFSVVLQLARGSGRKDTHELCGG
jgi:hypothetical protein